MRVLVSETEWVQMVSCRMVPEAIRAPVNQREHGFSVDTHVYGVIFRWLQL